MNSANDSTNSDGSVTELKEGSDGYMQYLAFVELEYFFRIFCVINIISFIVISNFLRNQYKSTKPWNAYRVYCISLAFSDLLISIDGFFAVSELDSFFTSDWVLQTLVRTYAFFIVFFLVGVFSFKSKNARLLQ